MTVMDLWLPILVAAVFVFVASAVLHMVLPLHRTDYKGLEKEKDVTDALRAAGVRPGMYMFPHCTDMKEMQSPEMMEKFKQGPVGHMTILPSGPPAMGKALAVWFVYTLIVSVFVAYIGALGLNAMSSGAEVFRLTGATAVLAYATYTIPEAAWKGQSWGVAAKFIFDGVVYGLLTGAAFAWLWPEAL